MSRPSERLGPWILEQRLGEGGFGTVFRARHAEHPRLVRAIKRIRSRDPDLLRRCQREAELLARISHPGVVKIHDVGHDAEGFYLVLDLAEGRTLRTILGESPAGVPLERACTLVSQIARAVGAAHAAGIVHRDLKPENVLVGQEDAVRVLDFGLALASFAERLTHTGSMLGTLGYMAPEQIDGARELQGPATDVFALGAILHETLTGRPIASGSLAARLAQTTLGEHERASVLRPGVPREVDSVIERALALEPRDRFPDGNAFADAVEALQGAALERERARAARGRRVRAARVAVAGALASVALGGAGFAAYRVAFVQPESVAALEARADSLDPLAPDARALDVLARDRAALPSRALVRARVGLDALDRKLARLALVSRLASASRDEAVAAASQLWSATDRRLATRAIAVLLREARGSVELRRVLESSLGRSDLGREGRAALADALVGYALDQPAARRAELLEAARTELGSDYDDAAVRAGRERAAGDRDGAIAALGALAMPMPLDPAPPARTELATLEARLRLARADARRASDPDGAIDDRRAAFDLAPSIPSPSWYAGFVARRALELDRALHAAPETERRERQRELAIAVVEALVEDAAWAWPLTEVGHLEHDTEGAYESRLVEEVARAVLVQFVHGSPDATPLPRGLWELARDWKALPRRVRSLALASARRTARQIGPDRGEGAEEEPDLTPALPEPSPDDPRDQLAAAYRLCELVRTPDRSVVEGLADRAAAILAARVAAIAGERALDPDADLLVSELLARARLASALADAAGWGPAEAIHRSDGESPGPRVELDDAAAAACEARLRSLLGSAIAACPDGPAFRRLSYRSYLVQWIARTDPKGAIEAARYAEGDLAYEAVVQNRNAEIGRVEDILSILLGREVADFRLGTPDFADADACESVRHALIPKRDPLRADELDAIEAKIVDDARTAARAARPR